MNRKKINKILSSVLTGAYIVNSFPVLAMENIDNTEVSGEILDEKNIIESREEQGNDSIVSSSDKIESTDNEDIDLDDDSNIDSPSGENKDFSNENNYYENDYKEETIDEIEEDYTNDSEKTEANLNNNEINNQELEANLTGKENENLKAVVQKIRSSFSCLKPTIKYSGNQVTIVDNGVLYDVTTIKETFDNPDQLNFNFSNPKWTVSDGKMKSEKKPSGSTTKNSMALDLNNPATLTLNIEASSGKNANYTNVYLNGTLVDRFSGNLKPTNIILDLQPGINTVELEFTRDIYNGNYGDNDFLYINEVSLDMKNTITSDKIQYRINNGEWIDYTSSFYLDYNNVLEARSVKEGIFSEVDKLDTTIANIPDENLLRALNLHIKKKSSTEPIYKHELKYLTGRLDLYSNNITDLTGLENLENITVLGLGNNNIEDITPIKNIVKLRQLYLNDNKISSVENLENLYNLEILSVANNKLSDVAPISSLKKMLELDLSGNKEIDEEDFFVLSNLPLLRDLSISVTFNNDFNFNRSEHFVSLEELTFIDSTMKNITIKKESSLSNINIEQSTLENLVLEDSTIALLSIRDNTKLNNLKVQNSTLNELYLFDIYVSEIHLDNFNCEGSTDINTVSVDRFYITNTINPINSYNMDIYGCSIEDFKLTNFNGIYSLSFRDCTLGDIQVSNSDIANLSITSPKSIKSLNIFNNENLEGIEATETENITDNSPFISANLSNLPNLSYVNFGNLGLEDIIISDCNAISSLDLHGNRLTSIENLSVDNVSFLVLSDNKISDISVLSNCSQLEYAELDNNYISDISALGNCNNLMALSLINNRVNDISPLINCNNLMGVMLDNNCILDFSPLNKIASLAPNIQYSSLGTQNVTLKPFYAQNGEVLLQKINVLDFDGNQMTLKNISNNGQIVGDSISWGVYEEGTYYETIEFESATLNCNVIVRQPIYIDKTTPEITIAQDKSEWTNEDVILTIIATDSNSGIDYIELYDGSKIYSSEVTVNIEENDTYSFKAYDKAGNMSEKSIVVSNIDKEKSIASSSVIYNNNKTEAIIKLEAADAISDIESITTPEGKTIKDNKVSVIIKENGTYEFTIKDLAGNETIEKVIISEINNNQLNNDSLNNPNKPTDNIPNTGGTANMLFMSYMASFVAGLLFLRKRK